MLAGSGNDSIVVASGAISSTLRGGVGNDLVSVSSGITDGALFGGDGNDSFNTEWPCHWCG